MSIKESFNELKKVALLQLGVMFPTLITFTIICIICNIMAFTISYNISLPITLSDFFTIFTPTLLLSFMSIISYNQKSKKNAK